MGDRDDVTMYYPVIYVTQCEGQLSTDHLNGGSMITPQSEWGKKEEKKKKKEDKEKKSGLWECQKGRQTQQYMVILEGYPLVLSILKQF